MSGLLRFGPGIHMSQNGASCPAKTEAFNECQKRYYGSFLLSMHKVAIDCIQKPPSPATGFFSWNFQDPFATQMIPFLIENHLHRAPTCMQRGSGNKIF